MCQLAAASALACPDAFIVLLQACLKLSGGLELRENLSFHEQQNMDQTLTIEQHECGLYLFSQI